MSLFLVACGGSPSGDAESASESTPAAQPEATADTANVCVDMGPQTPRDISLKEGANTTALVAELQKLGADRRTIRDLFGGFTAGAPAFSEERLRHE